MQHYPLLMFFAALLNFIWIFAVVWNFTIAIEQAISIKTKPGSWDSDEIICERYGVPLVSGFYGVGCWALWLLIVISVIISKTFMAEDDPHDRWGHIFNLNINLIGAFAYPFVASIDVLAKMHTYFSDDEVSERDMARFDAPVVVIWEGMVLVPLIMVACVVSSIRHDSPRLPSIFSLAFLIYLILINKLIELRYCRVGWSSYANVVIAMPYHQSFDRPQSALAMKHTDFACQFRGVGSEKYGSLPFFPIGLFTDPPLIVEIAVKLGLFGIPTPFAPMLDISQLADEYLMPTLHALYCDHGIFILLARVYIHGLTIGLVIALQIFQLARLIFVTGLPPDYRAMGLPDLVGQQLSFTREIYHLMLCATLFWLVLQLAVDIYLNFIFMCIKPTSLVPITDSKITDLDQITALIINGVLVLVFSMGGILNICPRA